jgi:hypothetical protein
MQSRSSHSKTPLTTCAESALPAPSDSKPSTTLTAPLRVVLYAPWAATNDLGVASGLQVRARRPPSRVWCSKCRGWQQTTGQTASELQVRTRRRRLGVMSGFEVGSLASVGFLRGVGGNAGDAGRGGLPPDGTYWAALPAHIRPCARSPYPSSERIRRARVQERLSRMFACTVARTQDRNGRVLRSELCTANVRMALTTASP